MGVLVEWIIFLLVNGMIVLLGGASMSGAAVAPPEKHVECGLTRYPGLCDKTLLGMGYSSKSGLDNNNVISALLNKTILETKLPYSYFSSLTSKLDDNKLEDHQAKEATEECEELLGMSLKRLEQSQKALNSPLKNRQDIQTWLSAAITFHQACKDNILTQNPDNNNYNNQISNKMDYLSELASLPLALVNKITKQESKNYPKTRKLYEEHDGFPSWVSARDRRLLQSTSVEANAVVAKDGSGDYTTVSEAITAASGGRFVIYVKSGVYKEKINIKKDGITLIGDGKYSTIISYGSSVGGGSSLTGSATFTTRGDGFIARDIGFQNTAGPGGEQAVALLVAGDHSVFYRCSVTGYQDTLYALALRQFYRECDISGTVDFIFGNAAAVIQSCQITLRSPGSKPYDVILASGRSDPGQNTGFSLQNCKISAGSGSKPSYLGRPWKYYSRSVVMQSSIDDVIAPRGWIEWPGYGSSVLKTLYFAEYANSGPGAGTAGRVNWPGFHVIGADDAARFTVKNFIAGTSWLPATGVAFVAGL